MLGNNRRLIDVFGEMSDFFQPPEDALVKDPQERFWITEEVMQPKTADTEERREFCVTAVVCKINTDGSGMTIKKDRIDETTLRVRIANAEGMPPDFRRIATDERMWLDAIIAYKKYHNIQVKVAPDLPEWSIGSS